MKSDLQRNGLKAWARMCRYIWKTECFWEEAGGEGNPKWNYESICLRNYNSKFVENATRRKEDVAVEKEQLLVHEEVLVEKEVLLKNGGGVEDEVDVEAEGDVEDEVDVEAEGNVEDEVEVEAEGNVEDEVDVEAEGNVEDKVHVVYEVDVHGTVLQLGHLHQQSLWDGHPPS
ncbi:unnamed protein product [Dibothriocephalus latus]|uniref:Uncharacterized protein n=1 Tax=Dibothriocephalus latus TaxID=60516 RepID=A0A3P7MHV8_DIBLA|nr:unnamed protein product [Dibothriocephalus latus]